MFLFILGMLMLFFSGCTAQYGYRVGRSLDERNHTLREITVPRLELLPRGAKLVIVRTDATVSQGYLLSYRPGDYVELSKNNRSLVANTYVQPVADIRRIYLIEEPHTARTLLTIGGIALDVVAPVLALFLLLAYTIGNK